MTCGSVLSDIHTGGSHSLLLTASHHLPDLCPTTLFHVFVVSRQWILQGEACEAYRRALSSKLSVLQLKTQTVRLYLNILYIRRKQDAGGDRLSCDVVRVTSVWLGRLFSKCLKLYLLSEDLISDGGRTSSTEVSLDSCGTFWSYKWYVPATSPA